MKKEVKNRQGFICEDLNEKKRIWEKLTDAGYPMHSSYEDCDKDYLHIVFSTSEFCGGFSQNITEYLNEDKFFGENEWTPENEEMTHEQKLEYMNLAGGIVGFRFADKELDMLVTTYDLIIEKQGRTDIADLCKVRADVNDRHKIIEP